MQPPVLEPRESGVQSRVPETSKDRFEGRLRELIESRRPSAASPARAGRQSKPAPVVDIMEALRKSMANARKPVRSEAAERQSPGAKKRRAK